MFQKVNEAYVSLYGEIHPSTLNSLINLATVHRDLHEYETAVINYYNKVFTIILIHLNINCNSMVSLIMHTFSKIVLLLEVVRNQVSALTLRVSKKHLRPSFISNRKICNNLNR